MEIKNSTVFVTGANRGIGRAFVEALLERGARRVYAAARNVKDLDAVRALDGRRIYPIQLDITNPDQVAKAVAAASDVTLLVNNAGIAEFGSLLQLPHETVRRNMETNYFGTLNVSREFSRVIEKNGGGAIVNVLTIVALASMPGLGAYNASKAAAWSMTQSMRAELSKRGIQVYGVFPGPVDTDMSRGFEMAKAAPGPLARTVLDAIERGEEDIFPDAMSQQVYSSWRQDHKAVERQFAAM